MSLISIERSAFHKRLITEIITINNDGVLSIADSSSASSKAIARGAVELIGSPKIKNKLPGQQAGSKFEDLCKDFLEKTFLKLDALRPGNFEISRGGAISNFTQYHHLQELSSVANTNLEVATALGQDYLIKPDILISRHPESDSEINKSQEIVSPGVSGLTPIRQKNSHKKSLHATISCKYTIRSDRAQNARSEALNVIRNRKGHTPHIAVITAEPLPSRLASLALGTGDIDCVYHAFLEELLKSVSKFGSDDSAELLEMMIQGQRLRDISDLPLDLVI